MIHLDPWTLKLQLEVTCTEQGREFQSGDLEQKLDRRRVKGAITSTPRKKSNTWNCISRQMSFEKETANWAAVGARLCAKLQSQASR